MTSADIYMIPHAPLTTLELIRRSEEAYIAAGRQLAHGADDLAREFAAIGRGWADAVIARAS